MVLISLPNGKLCLKQNTELHAEVKRASAQMKTVWPCVHLATKSELHAKFASVIKTVHSQFQPYSWLRVPWPSLCSPRLGFHRCLLSPKASAVGQSAPLTLCLCLSPKPATGNALEILTFKSLSHVFILANWAPRLRWYFIYIFFYERTWLDCEASW